jgi:hypothetical protein
MEGRLFFQVVVVEYMDCRTRYDSSIPGESLLSEVTGASIRGRGEKHRSEAFKETDDYVDRWGRMDVSMEPRIM